MPSTRLTLFDLDHTLLSTDSDQAWIAWLIEQGVLDGPRFAAADAEMNRLYRGGAVDIVEFASFYVGTLASRPRRELDALHPGFMAAKILPQIPDAARALVRRHQDQGDLVAIITATNRFIATPIAAAFGVAHLIATEPEIVAGEYTGKLDGIPSFREGKIVRLDEWLARRGRSRADFAEIHFYSDSVNDIPLLSLATHPVAVDPDAALQAHALARGWPVLRLRELSARP